MQSNMPSSLKNIQVRMFSPQNHLKIPDAQPSYEMGAPLTPLKSE